MFKSLSVIIIVFCTALFSGCYDSNEIDTLATVMAVGVEKGNSGGKRIYTFAVSDTGGFNPEKSGDGTNLICYTEESESLESAIDIVDRKISKKLSFSHLSLILFSKEAGKMGMYNDLKFFEKDTKVRPQVMISLIDMKPQKYLKGLKPELEANPEKYFQSIFQRSKTYVSAMRLSDFSNAYYSKNTVLVPVISSNLMSDEVTEQDAYITSSAIVDRGRVVYELPEEVFPGLLFSFKKVEKDGIEIKSVKKPQIDVKFNNQLPIVKVKLFVKAEDKSVKKSLENETEEFLKSLAEKSCDIINISKLSKKNFNTIGSYEKYNWDKMLPKAEFDVVCEVISEGEI